jgi:hypothetical protein
MRARNAQPRLGLLLPFGGLNMNATDVIGYAYLAAEHCPACTLADQSAGKFRGTLSDGTFGEAADNHGIFPDATDREGNTVRPIFADDSLFFNAPCDTCRRPLVED